MYENKDSILNEQHIYNISENAQTSEPVTERMMTAEEVAMGATSAGVDVKPEAEPADTEETAQREAVQADAEETAQREVVQADAEGIAPGEYAPMNTEADAQQTNQTESGIYSGYAQQNNYSAQSTGSQPWSAKDIQPRKKMGWGKRIVALILCGLILGGSTAGAYFGVTYLINRFTPAESEQTSDADVEVVKKEPEINQVETASPVQSGHVTVGVAYDVSPVVESVMPAMVSIINNYTETYSTFFGQSYTQEGASSGSGIIIGENDTELLIATNYHVVEGNDALEITFIDGTVGQAHIKGTNPDMDLAVVSVALDSLSAETKSSIAVASLGNSDELKLGQPVIAIGNALGYGQSVTTGVVSALDREIAVEEGSTGSFIQTDAAINPGNSGGALLNMNGEVIGINSSKIGGSAIEGMGYAIPISAAEPIISDLSLQTTKVKVDAANRGYLGVSIKEIPSTDVQKYGIPQGVLVAEVVKGSAAEAAGMRMYDIIVGFDTFEISEYTDLQEALQYYAAGTTVPVEVMRIQNSGYQRITLQVTLGVIPQ